MKPLRLKNRRGTALLETSFCMFLFLLIISYCIDFAVYSYTSILLSQAVQEAGRVTIASMDTGQGETAGNRYLVNLGMGNMISDPQIDVNIIRDASMQSRSYVSASVSARVQFGFWGQTLFADRQYVVKEVKYFLEETFFADNTIRRCMLRDGGYAEYSC